MRLLEIASAQEQMALWKLISDSVWAAINRQAKEEAERTAVGGARGKRVVGSSPKASSPPAPPFKPAKPPASPQQKMQPKIPVSNNKLKSATQPTDPPMMQKMPAKPIVSTARSNAVPLNPSSTSSASLSDKNAAATRQSIAQTQRQLYPLANDATVKRLTR